MAAGGFDTNGPLASVEIYNPTNGVWTPTGSLQTPRGSHTATLLPNGKVLVAGGADLAPRSSERLTPIPRASAEIFDPATGAWTPTARWASRARSIPPPCCRTAKSWLPEVLAYFGGVFPTSAELYDPVAGKWSPTFPLVSGRQDHIAALLPDGKVLVAGGFNNADTGPTAEVFDPASVVPAPFLLTRPTRLLTGAIQFTFRNTPGLGFTVLSTTNLSLPVEDWTSPGIALEISPGHYQFTDVTPDSRLNFYVVRSP